MGKDNLDSSVKTKFKSLFEKINEPKYVLDNYYSDNLINKIVENRKGDQYISTLTDLLVEPIKNLENYHVTVQVFLIRLLAICAQQDVFLAKSLSAIKNTLIKGYSGIGTPSMIPSLQVAYLEVALALLEQCTGVAWLITTGVWREIISANNSSKTVFVMRQKYKFVSKLVWKLNDIDDEINLKQVLTLILKPLIESDIMIRKSITAEEEEEILKDFEPMLHMLHSVMSEYSQLTLPSLVVNILLNQIKVVTHLFVVLDKFRMDILTSLITKLIFRFILAKIFYGKPLTDDTVHTAEDFVEISAAYFNTVNFFISRRNAMSVLDYCYSCNEIWNNMWGRKTPTMSTLDGKKVDIQNKMLFMCLIPAITYITRHMPVHEFQQEGNIQDYIMKLINASCEHTGKTGMLLSKLSLELDLDNIVLQSVKRLSSLNKTMNNEQANIMFQGLFYVLKELSQSDCKSRANRTPESMFQEDQENMFMYTYVLDAILQLVKNYDINWHESLEVICLYNLVYGILQKLSSSSKGDLKKNRFGSAEHKKVAAEEQFGGLFSYGFLSGLKALYENSILCGSFIRGFKKDATYTNFLTKLLLESRQKQERYHVSVQVFLVRMLGLCVRDELCCTNILYHINESLRTLYVELSSSKFSPSLRVAYIEVALSLADQNTGLYWLLDGGSWQHIFKIHDDSNTIFVTREKYKFVSKLVWRLNSLQDEANLKIVLSFILKPLKDIDVMVLESITSQQEDEAAKHLEPMLHLLEAVLSEYRELIKSSLVISILSGNFKLAYTLCVLNDRFRKESLTTLLNRTIFRMFLAKVLHLKPLTDDTVYNVEDFIEIRAMYFNTLNFLTIRRRNALRAIEFCFFCNEIWAALWRGRKPETCVDGRKDNLQNKALYLTLVAPLAYVTRHLPKAALQDQGCIQDYIMKLIEASCDHTAKVAQQLTDIIKDNDGKVSERIVLNCVKRLMSLSNSMDNVQANYMFQGLFYVLKHFDPSPEHFEYTLPMISNPEERAQQDEENVVVYAYVIETVLLLITKYDINWQESLEIVCLYGVVSRILLKPNLPTKFVVTALNVIAVTVRKFLPPNLSLLMDSKPGSAIHDLGRLIYMKMHDMHWEVRDSALELLHTCTEISYIKFPPFQKQIIENDLIVVATAIALNDHEFYVRASALRCLGAACKIAAIWDGLRAKHPDIQDSLLSVLQHNPEGIVRKEACNVLCDIYQNVKLCPRFRLALHEHMVAAAVSDFHWEVQIAALTFWKMVICHNLSEQGMLDGTFPPVTFSKESRKIVTLNKTEIQKRLMKTLDELASVGCLTVLTKLLHEDTEVEVMDKNLTISLDFLNILKHYEVPECLKPVEGEPRTIQEYYTVKIKEESMDEDDVVVKKEENESENVIESIINVDDMNLLAHIYERHMKLQNEKPELLPKPIMRYVQPYLYVNHLMSKDFKTVIEYKKQWRDGIRSVESILDDVLGVYEIGQDVNNLDCY